MARPGVPAGMRGAHAKSGSAGALSGLPPRQAPQTPLPPSPRPADLRTFCQRSLTRPRAPPNPTRAFQPGYVPPQVADKTSGTTSFQPWLLGEAISASWSDASTLRITTLGFSSNASAALLQASSYYTKHHYSVVYHTII